MTAAKLIRQTHRWLSVIFILCVLAATWAAISGQDAQSLLYYVPLPPLFILMASGLYLFFQPYVARWRGKAGTRVT